MITNSYRVSSNKNAIRKISEYFREVIIIDEDFEFVYRNVKKSDLRETFDIKDILYDIENGIIKKIIC